MYQPVRLPDGSVLLHFSSFTGRTYQVLGASALGEKWQVLTSAVASADGTAEYKDTAAARIPQRIYRVEWP
jgi:hypothetical protein